MQRIARVAFEAARKRGKRLCSVEKSNVLEVGVTSTTLGTNNCSMQAMKLECRARAAQQGKQLIISLAEHIVQNNG